MKEYYEFNNADDLYGRLKYWSNACGELHYHGKYDLDGVSELPAPLQRAYNEVLKCGNGCLEYLVEFDGEYYIALVSESDRGQEESTAGNMPTDGIFEKVSRKALELYETELFKDTLLLLGKETGCDGCHEFFFLVPADTDEDVYDKIEETITGEMFGIWNRWNKQTNGMPHGGEQE